MSKIEWTGETWNPVVGCDKISDGCKNCYAINMANRCQGIAATAEKYAGTVKRTAGGKLNWTGKINLHEPSLLKPLQTKKPTTFFVNSMSDLFHDGVPFEFVDKIFAVMALCPQHTFQVLTKRPKRMVEYFKDASLRNELIGIEAELIGGIDRHTEDMRQRWTLPFPNVWLGVSVEDQKAADERIPLLLQVPAAVRFLSMEPLLGAVDLTNIISGEVNIDALGGVGEYKDGRMFDVRASIDWVIAGGESGHDARPMHPDWVRSLRDQCKQHDVPFFFKQWGEWQEGSTPVDTRQSIIMLRNGDIFDYHTNWIDTCGRYTSDEWNRQHPSVMSKIGKKAAGRLLDGVEHNVMPVVK